MKGFNKKLLVASFTLLFAVVATVASTFAWFTMNTTSSVSQFDLQVTAGEGMMISLNGQEGTYKSTITREEILAFLLKGTDNSGWLVDTNSKRTRLLDPITSVNGTTFLNLKGLVTGTNNVFDNLTFYFRSQNKLDVRLQTASVTGPNAVLDLEVKKTDKVGIWADNNTFKSDIFDYSEKEDPELENLRLTTTLANAIRYSFEQKSGSDANTTKVNVFDLNSQKGFGGRDVLVYKSGTDKQDVYDYLVENNLAYAYLNKVSPEDLYENGTTINFGAIKNTDQIFLPTEDVTYNLYNEVKYGEIYQEQLDRITNAQNAINLLNKEGELTPAEQGTLAAIIDYFKNDGITSDSTVSAYEAIINTANIAINGLSDNDKKVLTTHYSYPTLLTLSDTADGNGWYTGSIQLRVWCEGWDADCFDVLFEEKVYINFTFVGTKIESAPAI